VEEQKYRAWVWQDLLVLDAAQDGRFDLYVYKTLSSFYIPLLSFLFLITRLNYITPNNSGTHSQVRVQAGNLCSFFRSLETRGTNFSLFIFSTYVSMLDRKGSSELLKEYWWWTDICTIDFWIYIDILHQYLQALWPLSMANQWHSSHGTLVIGLQI